MTDELTGKQVGGYEILDQIGRGGMATVYRATQTSMNRVVAFKILPRHHMRDDTYIQRFEREVKIVAQLEHRNIVPVYDYGEYDGQPYIAMRYMSGGSVDDRLNRIGLPIEQVLKVLQQVAPALDYAHTKGVLHRDLKPSNILMDDDGGAYITDFGIARIVGETQGPKITTQGVVGTPSYMSPEQAQGHELDGRSDVYSLGVMLFEMLTGRRPFENDTPYSIAVMQVTTPAPALRNINPKISGAVEQVVLKALKKKPENRYETAVQLAEAFQLAIERPEAIHDTQPHPIAIQPTVPTNVQPQQQTVPSLVVQRPVTPAPVYAPPSQPSRPVGMGTGVRRRRQRDTFWRNIFIGSVIGCGLLSLVVFGAFILVDGLLNDATPTPDATELAETPPADGIEAGSINVTTDPLDLTSEAARQELLTPRDSVDSVGVRTATPLPSSANGDSAAASADSNTQLVFFANDEDTDDLSHIYLYDLEEDTITQLTEGDTINSYPMVSPDGTRMVFQSQREEDWELYIMELDSGAVTQLTQNDVLDRLAAWSPDGQWIVYSSDPRDDGNYDIFRIPARGGDPEQLFSNGQRNSHPRYSPDGETIVFTSGQSNDANTWEITLFELTTGQRKTLTSNRVRDASPTFSPDGESILYITNSNGGFAIVRIDVQGSKPETIYESRAFIWGANYSPDGQYITFNAEENGVSTLYIMEADGTGLQEIEERGGFYPTWVPQ